MLADLQYTLFYRKHSYKVAPTCHLAIFVCKALWKKHSRLQVHGGQFCLLLACCLLGRGGSGQDYSLHSLNCTRVVCFPGLWDVQGKNLLTSRAALLYSSVHDLHLPGSLQPQKSGSVSHAGGPSPARSRCAVQTCASHRVRVPELCLLELQEGLGSKRTV